MFFDEELSVYVSVSLGLQGYGLCFWHSVPFRFEVNGVRLLVVRKKDAAWPLVFQLSGPLLCELLPIGVLDFDKETCGRAPDLILRSVSGFSHAVGWSHSLQSAIFLFEAQALILQFGFPSPFKHP